MRLELIPAIDSYIWTLKVLEKWGLGCHFFGFGIEQDIDQLEALLKKESQVSTDYVPGHRVPDQPSCIRAEPLMATCLGRQVCISDSCRSDNQELQCRCDPPMWMLWSIVTVLFYKQ